MIERIKEAVARAIAFAPPRRVVYWAGIRMWAEEMRGSESQSASEAVLVDALRKWRH